MNWGIQGVAKDGRKETSQKAVEIVPGERTWGSSSSCIAQEDVKKQLDMQDMADTESFELGK